METDREDVDLSDQGPFQEVRTRIERIEERLASLEAADGDPTARDDSVLRDPDLVHRIVPACMDADTIDECEDLRILRELLGYPRRIVDGSPPDPSMRPLACLQDR